MSEPTDTPPIKRIVKQVLSGDSVILRDKPRGGPPKESQVGLCWISAPKMGRKGGNREEVPEDLGAFEAREFLRKRLVGKEVLFKKCYSVPIGSGGSRDCGLIYLEGDPEVSLNEKLVEEGYAEVIRRRQEDSPVYKQLLQLEEQAKDAKRGKWAPVGDKKAFKKRTVLNELSQETADHLRDKAFKDAIVEYIQSADQMRIALLMNKDKAEWQMITLRLSGIKCRTQDQPFAEEAKFFVESRLLQKDVTVKIEQMQRTGDNPILFGSIFGGKDGQSNIAVALLKEGFATIIDSTLRLTADPSQYRQAVAEAKSKRLRIWKDYKGDVDKAENGVGGKESFEGRVVEIINGDALNVLSFKDNQVKKIFLASIRPPPRRADAGDQKIRALYDTPFMFEAREFLRKRLIGKKVTVIVDYIQPKTENYPEKTCATVMLGSVNIGEALVSKGYATVVKYRADEERKASKYDQLLDAEIKAEKGKKGLHGKEGQSKKIVDLSNDPSKAKSFMTFLTRSGQGGPRKEGLVEHVYSSSRIKVYIPKENCLINLIIGGINASKPNDDQYGKDGCNLVKSLVHQRDVQLSIESMDKVGNYIGYVYYETENNVWKNLSLTLIEEGLAKLRDARDTEMIRAEEEAKNLKKGVWKDWTPEVDEESGDDVAEEENGAADEKESGDTDDLKGEKDGLEKKVKAKDDILKEDLDKLERIVVVEVSPDMSTFYVQNTERGKKLEQLLSEMREELIANPPLPCAYTFKKGDIVAAKFSQDGQWYRGKIDKINPNTKAAEILFVDYGNRETVAQKDLAPLPATNYSLTGFPAAAQLYGIAFMTLPANDTEAIQEAKEAFEQATLGKELLLREEYPDTINGTPVNMVSLFDPKSKQNIGLDLVREGYFMVKTMRERRKDRKFNKLLNEFKSAQETAKRKRLVLWVYGDNTEDDAKEFGLSK